MTEGTKCDIAIKSKKCKEDLWFPIQLKCTKKVARKNFRFRLHGNTYENMMLLCLSLKPVKIWIFDGNDETLPKDTISIGINSKHKSKEIKISNIITEFHKFMSEHPSFFQPLENLNIPNHFYGKKEQEFELHRIKSFPKINFVKSDNYSVTDFTINNFKIQEKTGHMSTQDTNSLRYTIRKSVKSKRCGYDMGDNDYYWLHYPDKTKFVLISEQTLYDKGFISKDKEHCKTTLCININNPPYWIQKCIYEYSIEDEEKLLKIFETKSKKDEDPAPPKTPQIDIDKLLENNEEENQAYINSKYKAKEYHCIDCNAKIHKKSAERCAECYNKNRVIIARTEGRPSYQTLKKLLSTKTQAVVASMYNVSQPCIPCWLKKYEKYGLTDE